MDHRLTLRTRAIQLSQHLARWALKPYVGVAYRRQVSTESCDLLMLFPREILRQRSRGLHEALTKEGLQIRELVMDRSPKHALVQRPFCKPELPMGDSRFVYDAYASYLVARYRPKAIVTFLDASELSGRLRYHLSKIGGKLVNISHGMTSDDELYQIYDFDYYFVFGQSSIDAAKRQKHRIGSTKLVKTGSFLIRADFELEPNRELKKIVFFSDGTEPLFIHHVSKVFELLRDWAKQQSGYELLIKHHPLENPEHLRKMLTGIPRVTFLPIDCDVKTAVNEASFALTGWSNAAVEGAVLNRPPIALNPSGISDSFLRWEEFFGSRPATPEELSRKIEELAGDYDSTLEKTRRFVRGHLSHTIDSIPAMVSRLRSIVEGREDFEFVEVQATPGSAAHPERHPRFGDGLVHRSGH